MASPASSSKRAMPMQVLVLGLCRTGTQSLASALELLGFGPVYHMKHVAQSGHAEQWIKAYEIKYEGRTDAGVLDGGFFDEMLGGYGALSDLPTASFAKELMLAYPHAKIILTTRSPDSWVASMKSTIIHAHQAKLENPDSVQNPSLMLKLAMKYHEHIWGNDIEKNGEEELKRHNEMVVADARELGREVLVHEVREGWGPLCGFLGVRGSVVEGVVEGVGFPRVDDWGEYKKSAVWKTS